MAVNCKNGFINGINLPYYYFDCCGNSFNGTTTLNITNFQYVDFNKPHSANIIEETTQTQSCLPLTPPATKSPTPTVTVTTTPTPTITKTLTPTPSRSGLPIPVSFQSFNECSVYTTFPLEVSCQLITPASYKNDDGELEVLIKGGTPPYRIFWSNGGRDRRISGLSGGTYTVQVEDSYPDYIVTTSCEVPRILPPCEISGSATYLSPSTMFAVVLNNTKQIGKRINKLSYSSVTSNFTIGYTYPTNNPLTNSPIGYSAQTNSAIYIPNYGDVVRMQIPEIPTSPANLEFDPTLGCKMWYYTSNTQFNASEFITNIPLLKPLNVSAKTINSIDNYVAEFPFEYVGSPSFYYMVWDYRDYPDLKEFKVFAKGLTSFTASTIQSVFPGSTPFPFWVDFGDNNNKYFSGGTYTGFTTGYTSPYTGEITFKSTNLSAIRSLIFNRSVTANQTPGLIVTTKELSKLTGLINLTLGFPAEVDEIPNDKKPYLSGDTTDLSSLIIDDFNVGEASNLTGPLSGFPPSIRSFRIGENTLTGDMVDFRPIISGAFQILGDNTIYGDVKDIPKGVRVLEIAGNNTLSGNTIDLPTDMFYLNVGGFTTITGDIKDVPRVGVGDGFSDRFTFGGYNTVYGDVKDLPRGITSFDVRGFSSITGNTKDLPTTRLKRIEFSCSGAAENCSAALYGDVADLPSGLTQFSHIVTGSTMSGDCANIPTGCTFFVITGANTIGGDLGNLHNKLWSIIIKGNNQINQYTSKTWPNPMNRLDISGDYTGLTKTDIDQLLIDLDQSDWQIRSLGGVDNSGMYIGIKCVEPYTPSPAALTARNSLQNVKGVTVTITNM